MYYMGKVQCTKNGFPVCSLDERLCDVEQCRYYLPWPEIGNCVLRITDDSSKTFKELSISFGIDGKKVSKQRVDQIEKRALGKLRRRWGKMLREARSE